MSMVMVKHRVRSDLDGGVGHDAFEYIRVSAGGNAKNAESYICIDHDSEM